MGNSQRRAFLERLAAIAVAPIAIAPRERKATLYKNPSCNCCNEYASYLRAQGYDVEVVAPDDLDALAAPRNAAGLLGGCHLMVVGGYVVEGHVPAAAIERLLSTRPRIAGISLPGMPRGAPGMPGEKTERLRVMTLGEGEPRLFWSE
jgi:hypothetical protein